MNTSRPASHSLGFTLIETMVVVALSALMLGALGTLLSSFNSSTSFGQIAALSAESTRSIMREAEALTLVAHRVLPSHVFSGTAYTSSSAVLVLELPSIDSSGMNIPSTHDYAVLYTVGTYAYRTIAVDAASARVPGTRQLSSTVSSLTFTYNTTDFSLVDTVTIDVQTSAQFKEQTSTDHRVQQLHLRNF